MARFARAVLPAHAHHVLQRGNRRQPVFFKDEDRREYLRLLAKACRRHELEIRAYCLMDDHVHLVAVPRLVGSLAAALRDAHAAYALYINRRDEAPGHLWQGRFFSCVLDRSYAKAAVRYVETNPLRAGRLRRAERYPYSSAAAHCGKRQDAVLSASGRPRVAAADWSGWLQEGVEQGTLEALRLHTRTGRPLGSARFVQRAEALLGRRLGAGRRGRPPSKGSV